MDLETLTIFRTLLKTQQVILVLLDSLSLSANAFNNLSCRFCSGFSAYHYENCPIRTLTEDVHRLDAEITNWFNKCYIDKEPHA